MVNDIRDVITGSMDLSLPLTSDVNSVVTTSITDVSSSSNAVNESGQSPRRAASSSANASMPIDCVRKEEAVRFQKRLEIAKRMTSRFSKRK